MAETSIEWCRFTWSPWEGCTKISEGCTNCYAEARNKRFAKGANWGPGAPRRKTVDWTKPRFWNSRAAAAGVRERVFPSICDPFDNAVDPQWRSEFFDLIRKTPWLDWLLLTKRVGNVEAMVRAAGGWPSNAQLGITVVDQPEADRDIPKAIATKAALGIAILFLSVEPMLGEVDLLWHLVEPTGNFRTRGGKRQFESRPHGAINQVIGGGESGGRARPANPAWFRLLRDRCAQFGVAYLHKQNGEFVSVSEVAGPGRHHTFADGSTVRRVGTKAAGRLLDGAIHDGYPKVAHG